MNKTPYVTRCVDDLGRIVIPKEIRHAKNILAGDSLGIIPVDEGILIVPYNQNDSIKEQVSKLEMTIRKNYNVSCITERNLQETMLKKISEIYSILDGKPVENNETLECEDF